MLKVTKPEWDVAVVKVESSLVVSELVGRRLGGATVTG